MAPTTPPVLLLPTDGPPAGGDDDVAAPPGWQVHPGFDLPAEPWDVSASRLLCVGSVDDGEAAQAAITALTRGAGLAVRVTVRGAAHHRFLDDLHKLSAPVPYEPPGTRTTSELDPDQRDLLDALAAGATVTAAAAALHVSRRTANRRLAEARALLGVDSNTAAVRRWMAERPPGI
ncbi:helix-turn-helix domain-containing protein [Aquihabitans daechungensis]|uniref:helix-turn-helix domain-containing protein n=1 Tax=Aquihabitans daechungensis TaxID=1052257 RepID=UPI003B9E0DDE